MSASTPAIPRRTALLVLAGVLGLAAALQARNRLAAADREAAPLVAMVADVRLLLKE